jgi:hypothetical protein
MWNRPCKKNIQEAENINTNCIIAFLADSKVQSLETTYIQYMAMLRALFPQATFVS